MWDSKDVHWFESSRAHNIRIKGTILSLLLLLGYFIVFILKTLTMKNIDWNEIQKYYDDEHTWREISKKFNVSQSEILKAKTNKMFVSRNMSNAQKLSCKNTPRKLSQETKNKISVGRSKYLKEHPDQVPYLLNHYSKGESYPEKYFNEIFENNKVKCERYLQYSIYNLDFAIVDKLIDIEIDGEQHILDPVIYNSNLRRDKFLEDNGWRVIRILWSSFQKLTDDGKKEIIDELIDKINNDTIKKHDIKISLTTNGMRKIRKRYYCSSCGCDVYRTSFMCRPCSVKLSTNSSKPTKEQLSDLIENKTSWTEMGKMFSVSDNTIRKWAKQYTLI